MGLFEKLFGKKAKNTEPAKKAEAPKPTAEKKVEAAPAPAPTPQKVENPAPAPKAEAPAPKKEEKPAPKKEATSAPQKAETAPAQEAPKVKKAPAKKADAPKAEKPVAEPVKAEPAPVADAPKAAEEKARVTGKFEIKKAKDGRFVFNLYAPNRVIVATSQVYSSSTAAVNGINSVIANAEKAPVEDWTLKKEPEVLKFPKWEMYIDKGGQYRFKLYAANGSCICHSQGYTAKANCKNGIDSIIRCSRNPEIDKSYLKKED